MTKKCHFIGIGGIGMSGLARILLSKKMVVSGSDMASSYVTEGLQKEGAQVFIGHSSNYIHPDMTVVYSSDIKPDNSEYQAALKLKCPMLHRSDLLKQLTVGYKTLVVAGTHGKTTTSSLLATVLKEAKSSPSYSVGGIIKKYHANAENGDGEYFVAEGDESDGTFLKYDPFGAIVTNIDLDHMDYFGTEENLIRSFEQFARKVSSTKHLFWCAEDTRLKQLKLPGYSYGVSKDADLRASNIQQQGWYITFDITFNGKKYSHVKVKLIGKHNVLNALSVFGMAISLGIDESDIRSALETFEGVGRRCDIKGDLQKVLFIDDYAHHPTEIRTTLCGIREAIGERRLIAIYQPHRYTRTKDCLGSFGDIFDSADELILTDIYGAREKPIPGINSDVVLQEVLANGSVTATYVPQDKLSQTIKDRLLPHDVVVTLGAGDITKLGPSLIEQLKQSPVRQLKVGMICGGRSVEHEVALSSANYVGSGLQQTCYDVTRFEISKTGHWTFDLKKEKNQSQPVMSAEILNQLLKCDVIFPIMHGSYCEDGTIQGMFETLDIPYVGCDHRSSAVCMDKAMTKNIVASSGLNITPYITFTFSEWQENKQKITDAILRDLIFPVYVKPTHLGSSIAVSRVESEESLQNAVQKAFKVDTHVIVENAVNMCREIEFAVIGNEKITVLHPAEVYTGGQFLGYEGKYGPKALKMEPKAKLPDDLLTLGMDLAKKAYLAVGCSGFARVDFFLDPQNNFWFNEINPIPGCTPTSQFPIVCQANGWTSGQVIDRLIVLAMQRKRLQRRVNGHG